MVFRGFDTPEAPARADILTNEPELDRQHRRGVAIAVAAAGVVVIAALAGLVAVLMPSAPAAQQGSARPTAGSVQRPAHQNFVRPDGRANSGASFDNCDTPKPDPQSHMHHVPIPGLSFVWTGPNLNGSGGDIFPSLNPVITPGWPAQFAWTVSPFPRIRAAEYSVWTPDGCVIHHEWARTGTSIDFGQHHFAYRLSFTAAGGTVAWVKFTVQGTAPVPHPTQSRLPAGLPHHVA